jgi:aminoglycoside phosphotransferase (APT) family kinase protein
MAPFTNQMLNAKREKNCVGISLERKYLRSRDGQTWIKRSLRPSEWQINPIEGNFVVPRFGMERIFNEAATMQFITEKTDIPVPKLYGCFEDDGAAYLVMEYVNGVTMNELSPKERKVVEPQLEGYLETMRGLKSSVWGGPSGIVSSDLRKNPAR